MRDCRVPSCCLRRLAAARLIQAAWRGHLVRKQYRPQLNAAMLRLREQRAATAIQRVRRRPGQGVVQVSVASDR